MMFTKIKNDMLVRLLVLSLVPVGSFSCSPEDLQNPANTTDKSILQSSFKKDFNTNLKEGVPASISGTKNGGTAIFNGETIEFDKTGIIKQDWFEAGYHALGLTVNGTTVVYLFISIDSEGQLTNIASNAAIGIYYKNKYEVIENNGDGTGTLKITKMPNTTDGFTIEFDIQFKDGVTLKGSYKGSFIDGNPFLQR
jgi:hypothetical protein